LLDRGQSALEFFRQGIDEFGFPPGDADGFFTSRSAYSTVRRLFSWQSRRPLVGWSSLCRIWSSMAER
jgi:hypothetical protein